MNAPIAQRRRLTRSADFDVVYRRGRSRSSRHLVVYVFAGAGASPDEARLGITVPRKVGGAVVRNRLKRQLREAMAALGPDAARGSDVVVVARGRPATRRSRRRGSPGWSRSCGRSSLARGDEA